LSTQPLPLGTQPLFLFLSKLLPARFAIYNSVCALCGCYSILSSDCYSSLSYNCILCNSLTGPSTLPVYIMFYYVILYCYYFTIMCCIHQKSPMSDWCLKGLVHAECLCHPLWSSLASRLATILSNMKTSKQLLGEGGRVYCTIRQFSSAWCLGNINYLRDFTNKCNTLTILANGHGHGYM